MSIENTISSVKKQNYHDIEHIFVDGCSTDHTLKIIDKNISKNDIIISEKDDGIYDAINKGIKIASGQIIGLVHSDDILYSNDVVKNIVEIFKNKDVDAVYGDLKYTKNNKTVRLWKSGSFKRDKFMHGWMPPHPTLFIKSSCFQLHGLYDTKYRISADYDLILRYFYTERLNLHYYPKILVSMNTGGKSNKSIKNILIKMNEDYTVIKQNQIGGLLTLILKNTSKIKQFFKK